MNGHEAVDSGWANRCFPLEELETNVLQIAKRIAKIPTDILQFNKRSVHRAMEVMGMRTALRYGTDLQALSFHSKSSKDFMAQFTGEKGSAAKAFKKRDSKFKENDSSLKSKL